MAAAPIMTMPTTKPASDLLDHLELILPCNVCGTAYTIPASLVRVSQLAIADGCSGSGAVTCDAEFYARLLAPEVIASLTAAWEAFLDGAEHGGGLGVKLRETAVMANSAEVDELVLERWENEGGRCACASAAPRSR
jgi:hypothetical protein